jgi:hypothetical protein
LNFYYIIPLPQEDESHLLTPYSSLSKQPVQWYRIHRSWACTQYTLQWFRPNICCLDAESYYRRSTCQASNACAGGCNLRLRHVQRSMDWWIFCHGKKPRLASRRPNVLTSTIRAMANGPSFSSCMALWTRHTTAMHTSLWALWVMIQEWYGYWIDLPHACANESKSFPCTPRCSVSSMLPARSVHTL